MRPAELARMQQMEEQLAPLNPITVRLNAMLEAGMRFHEARWSNDPEMIKAWEKWVEKHPRLFAARERSFTLFFNKILPTKLIHQGSGSSRPKRIKPEDFQAMKLTQEQLRKLAAFSEDEAPTREENGEQDAGEVDSAT